MYKPYKKEYEYSYSLGFYPSLELAKYHSDIALKVIYSNKANDAPGLKLLKEKLPNVEFVECQKEYERLSSKGNDHVVVIFKKYYEKLDDDKPHIVLINPSDQGNLGNIMRSMAAFSYNNLAIISPAADHFNPKVIRASMGSSFFVKKQVFSSFEEYIRTYPRVAYSFMLQTNTFLSDMKLSDKKRYSLVFGNEARGLDDSFLNYNPIKIEQPGNVDSLNLPTAVAIALYETKKKEQ